MLASFLSLSLSLCHKLFPYPPLMHAYFSIPPLSLDTFSSCLSLSLSFSPRASSLSLFRALPLFVLSLAVLCAVQLKLHVCEDALTRKLQANNFHPINQQLDIIHVLIFIDIV